METDNIKYKTLVDKYLSGKLSDDDYGKLIEYINTDSHNKYYFRSRTRDYIPAESATIDKSWKMLNSKLSRGEELNRSFRSNFRIPKTLLRAAAIFIVALASGALLSVVFMNRSFKNEQPIVFSAPKGEKSYICLSDSTRVWLNGGTILELRKDFGITNRKISLTGEAYFEVTHNKRLPFIVQTESFETKVLGTKFSVEAYSDLDYVKTSVVEGRVQVKSELDKWRPIILTRNGSVVYDKITGKIHLSESEDVLSSIAWTQDKLIFENEHYLSVIRKLENWYGVEITVEGELDYEPHYTMTIKTETLRELLDLIYFITPLEYEIDGDQVTLRFKDKK